MTGVQTCALPIYEPALNLAALFCTYKHLQILEELFTNDGKKDKNNRKKGKLENGMV